MISGRTFASAFGVMSVLLAVVLLIPVGRLGSTSADLEDARQDAAPIDVCGMLGSLLDQRKGGSDLVLDDNPDEAEVLEFRHPVVDRRLCEIGDVQLPTLSGDLAFRNVVLGATTMASGAAASSRLNTMFSMFGAGYEVRDIREHGIRLEGFERGDPDSRRIALYVVTGRYLVSTLFSFGRSQQPVDPAEVLELTTELIDGAALDPDDWTE